MRHLIPRPTPTCDSGVRSVVQQRERAVGPGEGVHSCGGTREASWQRGLGQPPQPRPTSELSYFHHPNSVTTGKNPAMVPACEHAWEKSNAEGFPGGAVVKNPPANAGDVGSIPGPGRSHMPWSN